MLVFSLPRGDDGDLGLSTPFTMMVGTIIRPDSPLINSQLHRCERRIQSSSVSSQVPKHVFPR